MFRSGEADEHHPVFSAKAASWTRSASWSCEPMRSTCHIHLPHQFQNDGVLLQRGRRRQETTDYTDPMNTMTYGPWVETPLSVRTVETIGLVGEGDGPLSPGYLVHFLPSNESMDISRLI